MTAAWLFSLTLAASDAQRAPNVTPLAALCEVRVREVDGETLCTLRARNASVDTILAEISARVGCDVRGLDAFEERSHALDAALDDRPLSHVVHTVLGAAGLRASVGSKVIKVTRDLPDDPTQSGARELDEAIELATLRALRAFPDHPDGARAELRLGEVQERRENADAAVSHYRLLAQKFPRSELVADALLRSGTILMRARRFKEAQAEFTELANLTTPHAHQVTARLELARCMAHTGDPVQALFMLDALESLFPATTDRDQRERLLVRARALVGTNRCAEALTALERARELGLEKTDEHDVLELKARAFDHLGEFDKAARFWLAASRASRGELSEQALVLAARSAHAAHDEVAVLFIEDLARGEGSEDRLASWAQEARASLGLADAQRDAGEPARILERAQDELDSRLFRAARLTVESLVRGRVPADERTRTAAAAIRARALTEEKGLDAAIEELRAFVGTLTDIENQKQLFIVAGELYERAGRFDEAVLAYGGKL